MKVKCIKLLNASGEEVNFSHWLTLNKIYDVMSIEIESTGNKYYRIVTYWGTDDWPDMGLYQASCFEIVDTHAPENWGVSVNFKGYIEIAPKKWLENDFIDRFYEHEPDTFLVFKNEYDFIVGATYKETVKPT